MSEVRRALRLVWSSMAAVGCGGAAGGAGSDGTAIWDAASHEAGLLRAADSGTDAARVSAASCLTKTAAAGRSTASTADVYGRILDLGGDLSAPCPALPGVRICLLDTSNCTTSDGDGEYALDGVLGQESGITFQKEGYTSLLRTITGTPGELYGPWLVPVEMQTAAAEGVGVTLDPGRGALVAVGVQLPVVATLHGAGVVLVDLGVPEGTTTALLTGTADGPFYSASAGEPPDSALTATGDGGATFFFNVPPGDHALDVRVGGCAGAGAPLPWGGLPPNGAGNVRTWVRAGFFSNYAGVSCR